MPRRLCVIGGGVIGLEFASIFRSFGSAVTVVEYCKDILPRFDTDLAKRLKQSLGKRGIEINTQSQVLSIAENEGEYEVSFSRKGKEEKIVADTVLMAVGRRAALDSLNFSDIGIDTSRKGVEVNEFMQTSIPHIYAIGDINGQMMLAHAATFQGIVALDHIMGIRNAIDLSVMPAAVFTSPEAASVGLTEDECKEKGIPVKCLKSFFRANGKAVTMGETDGFCKIVGCVTERSGGSERSGSPERPVCPERSGGPERPYGPKRIPGRPYPRLPPLRPSRIRHRAGGLCPDQPQGYGGGFQGHNPHSSDPYGSAPVRPA